MDCDLVTVGVGMEVKLAPACDSNNKALQLPRVTVPVGLPPVLPSTTERLEALLSAPEDLPIHGTEHAHRSWPRTICGDNLYDVDVSAVQTTISVERNPTTGQLLGYKEEVLRDTGTSARNSFSLQRPPGPPDQSVKGCSGNFPFWPGGLEEPSLDRLVPDTEAIKFESDLLSTPPGFESGAIFEDILDVPLELPSISDLVTEGDLIDLGPEEQPSDEVKDEIEEVTAKEVQTAGDLDDIIKLDSRYGLEWESLGQVEQPAHKEQWAVPVDVSSPVDDFHKRVPDMARKWPFELDVFQKQAVLCLEQHESVFVAAHTSAGKTVVAEYAIALSMRHMTRTIYTSPIKALSNQKFRDFKTTFEDVGLITGDVQIRPEAACLIMTTEILRSMLYNGSDVIRDLEWVIFDEVHYINDPERGVVWEEVLIMLPQQVNIILLSATVPNAIEFADWVGRTKKRKVFVVSTQKRPVPLEHHLYTGNSGKTSNELFLLVDSNKKFLLTGYNKAVDAKKQRASKSSQSFGAKGYRGGNPAQDKNVWISVIDMLRKKDKLPIVAFTFSKKRIEENANHLQSMDLTTAAEKSEIHLFFKMCIRRLKEPDRALPQVKNMADLLKRGLGIHHSGVLPILKEVVEMLFGRGLVKVLFATETFAMGVNMPARTVVFDANQKHDGKGRRDLLPGEYIQMAGRAGRRGLDTTGTVIILCKGDVPVMSDLHKMMLGKPTKLESQFRLRYSMILNLLRVEQLRVEDMMKRSFSEFHTQRDSTKLQESLKEVHEQIEKLPQVVDLDGDLEVYYQACHEYFTLKDKLRHILMTHPQAIKSLTPGRVIVMDNAAHQNVLGVIVQAGPSGQERTYTALILCEQSSAEDCKVSDGDEEWPRPMLAARPLFLPEGPCGHKVLQLKATDIGAITLKTIKINGDRIVDDFKKRQQPRFRNDPPGQSVTMATQELLRLTESNPSGLPELDPLRDLHIRDMGQVDDIQRLKALEESFRQYACIHDPQFEEKFMQLRFNMKLKEKKQLLQFQLSDQSLQLSLEYQQRMKVLRALNHIDDQNMVQLKGKVACEISNHELIITELVFQNKLTELHPTEIAAVLSCVVFEQKRCSAPELNADLQKAKDEFLAIAEDIAIIQQQCGLNIPEEEFVEEFHFGLMEVVFEWARGMPFSQITELTDVQEGIIVRCIQRLDEVLKDVRNAARMVGDPTLSSKMEEASTAIKRDIVFAASLYTQT